MTSFRNPIFLTVALAATAAAQTPLYTLHGTDPAGRFGYVVRSIGDANGDGIADFGVGAPFTDANGIVDSGMLRTYSGATGLKLREYRGNGEFESSGIALAGAGDVDGDGKADILWADLDARFRYPGEFTVASGSTGRVLLRVFGENAYDYLGHEVCAAGDVDGDGYGDYVAGEPGNDLAGNCAGRVRVFSGRTKLAIRSFLGSGPNEDFGWSLSCAGDIDGDAIVDLVVGAPRADLPGRVDCGMVRMFSGRTGEVLYTWYGDAAGDRLGYSVQGNADANGDGIPDVVAGGRQNGTTVLSFARVFSGLDGSVLATMVGEQPGDRFGDAVAFADIDGDGRANVVVGAPQASAVAGAEAGKVFVFPDLVGGLPTVLEGNSAGAHFGFSLHGVDVDADGFDEVVVGAPEDLVGGIAVGSAIVFEFPNVGTPPMVSYRGAGCRGTDRLLPRIDVFGRPALGGTYEVGLRGALGSTSAALNIGNRLDLSLAPWAPDCIVHADPAVSFSATTSPDGMASIRPIQTIPNDPALIGVELDHQWIVIDAGAPNALGIALSNDAVVRFGV
jgi:hypothetical protein